jgi:NACalpha-BTF3-like transcription factor
MTPAQYNEYERQAQVIERHQKWKEQQKQASTNINEEDAKVIMDKISDEEIKKAVQNYLVTNCNQLTTK